MAKGGFGLLDIEAHVWARQAGTAAQLILMRAEWALIYREVFSSLEVMEYAPFHRLMLLNESGDRPWRMESISGITYALDALHTPRVRPVYETSVLPPPGPWCSGIPL